MRIKYFTLILFVCLSQSGHADENWAARHQEQQSLYRQKQLLKEQQDFLRKENDRLLRQMRKLERQNHYDCSQCMKKYCNKK